MMFKIELNDEQLVLVGEALGAMPYRRVNKIIAEIAAQVAQQQQAQQPPTPPVIKPANGDGSEVQQDGLLRRA